VKLIFDIDPVPASRPRVTRWGTYYGKKYTNFKMDMNELLDDYTEPILNGLLRCQIKLEIPLPKSYSIKKKNALEGKYCDNNSDVDNYAKGVMDALNGIVYKDDRQIVELIIGKKWAKCGKIVVELMEL